MIINDTESLKTWTTCLTNLKFGGYLDFKRRKENWDKGLATCKVCRTAIKCSSSPTDLNSHVETCKWTTRTLWMLVQLAQARTCKTKTNTECFFQPQLSKVWGNHTIYHPFYYQGRTTLQCSWEWWLLWHGKQMWRTVWDSITSHQIVLYHRWIASYPMYLQ